MILFLDTETTGLPDWKAPLDAPHQPHLVQLACLLFEDWDLDTPRRSLQAVIKPQGWEIPPEATKLHGFDTSYAQTFGEALAPVMSRFLDLVEEAEISPQEPKLVAHHARFDLFMIQIELTRLRLILSGFSALAQLKPFCTMEALTPMIKLPFPRGGSGFKWPSLSEVYHWMFPEASDLRFHNAMTDCLAVRDIYREGRKRSLWS